MPEPPALTAVAPRALSEHQLQTKITKALKTYGYLAQHVYRLRTADGNWRTSTTSPGWPDLLAVRGSWLLAIEVKGARGVVEPDQYRWLARFAGLPCGRAWVIRPRDDEHDWQAWLRHPEDAPRVYGWSLDKAASALGSRALSAPGKAL